MVDSVSDGGDVDHVAIEIANLSSSPTSTNNEKKTKSSFHPDPHIPWTTSLVPSREQRDVEFDQDMLSRAIADTGRWAYGTISVEAWVLDTQTGKLIRPKKAFWFDPVVVRDNIDNEAMLRLVDDGRDDFVRPEPLSPGVGLAGVLWSELSNGNLLDGRSRIVWREVEPISNDPDQPYNLRLQLAVKAGIGRVAGVKYQFRGTRGLVLYMARCEYIYCCDYHHISYVCCSDILFVYLHSYD